ncbi:MAG: hypothetical protein ACI82O_004477 [Patiriisocius sp.]
MLVLIWQKTLCLYIALGGADLGCFLKGKDASACIGLTPIQHTSGGKVKLGSIGRYVKNSLLRSQLITGAMAAVAQVCKRTAVTSKDLWIQELVARRGQMLVAAALAAHAQKTVLKSTTRQVVLKLARCVPWQKTTGLTPLRLKFRPIPLYQMIQQRLFGLMPHMGRRETRHPV